MFVQGVKWYNFGGGPIKLALTDDDSPELQVPIVKEEVKPTEE
jgi:hypothetical protein